MSDTVIVALIAAVPLTIGAISSFQANRKLKTMNGNTVGMYTEMTHDIIVETRDELRTHCEDTNAHKA